MKNNSSSQNQNNHEFKNRFDIKTLILVMILILLGTMIILWNPDIDTRYHEDRVATLTAQMETLQRPGLKRTPYPVNIIDYPEQTNGIVLGSVVILLIITGGTLAVIQRKE
jgi:hypothetical protein